MATPQRRTRKKTTRWTGPPKWASLWRQVTCPSALPDTPRVSTPLCSVVPAAAESGPSLQKVRWFMATPVEQQPETTIRSSLFTTSQTTFRCAGNACDSLPLPPPPPPSLPQVVENVQDVSYHFQDAAKTYHSSHSSGSCKYLHLRPFSCVYKCQAERGVPSEDPQITMPMSEPGSSILTSFQYYSKIAGKTVELSLV